MATANLWMPLYIGDYLSDTSHLCTLEHGAYFLIMMAYWKNQGPLPDDDKRLSSIAKLSLSDWGAIRSTVAEFFAIEDGKWVHGRIEKEIAEANRKKEARNRGAAITNQKRWGVPVAKRIAQRVPERVAQPVASESPSPSPSSSKEEDISVKCEEVYQAYPRKVGKVDALRKIRKAIQDFGFEKIMDRTKSYAKIREGQDIQFTPHPGTWYGQQRFNDDFESEAKAQASLFTPQAVAAPSRTDALKRIAEIDALLCDKLSTQITAKNDPETGRVILKGEWMHDARTVKPEFIALYRQLKAEWEKLNEGLPFGLREEGDPKWSIR